MNEAVTKDLSRKPAAVKAGPPVTPSRAFALWLALLVLYFLIVPSAADTPDRAAGLAAVDHPTPHPTPDVTPPGRFLGPYALSPRRP